MANSTVPIPPDIIDNIIEAVGNDRYLLKKCALVSSSFLLPSRKRLFSEIYIRDDQACQGLHQFLVENPAIQFFVRRIDIIGNRTQILKSHTLVDMLRLPFCCLESFTINNRWYASDWNDLSGELKDALSTVIHSSTLKTLYIEGVIKLPIMLFHGVHLTKLELCSLLINNFDGNKSTLLTSETSEAVTSDTVIDQFVWTRKVFNRPVHGRTEPIIFLPSMCHLRLFEIRVGRFPATMSNFALLSFLMRSLRISLMASPATLEHIKFYIIFDENDSDFHYYDLFDDLRCADIWSHLDSIITHPTGSRLQRVDINIQYCFKTDNDDDEWLVPDKTKVTRPVLVALPLLREKGILFVNVREEILYDSGGCVQQ